MNAYIERLSRIPMDVRRFIGAVGKRMHRMRDTSAVSSDGDGVKIAIYDLESALRLDESSVRKRLMQLESYGVGGFGQIDSGLGDSAISKQEPCRLYAPDLCEAAGLTERAAMERRRFEMITGSLSQR